MNLRAAKYTTSCRPADSSVDVRGFGALVIDSSNNNNNQRLVGHIGAGAGTGELWRPVWAHRRAERPQGVNEKRRLPWRLARFQPSSTTDPLSIITPANATNNANRPGQQLKALEHSINKLVEASCSATQVASTESALRLACEAVERLVSLRALLSQLQSSPRQASSGANRCAAPTSRLSAGELALMANSNLAAKLAGAGKRREAIELYVQLCKLATAGGPDKQPAAVGAATGRPASLLYRFGLNIGNLYCELGEHQQALKYYRLTLDRLSSLSVDYKSLRVRLMNNIVCCQLVGKQGSASPRHRQQQADTINSLNHLLTENARGPAPAEPTVLLHNGRHHLFGLALMALLSQTGADATLMLATWERHMVRVPVCHHYSRVSPLSLAVPVTQSNTREHPLPEAGPGESELSAATTRADHSLLLTDGQAETRDQLELLIEEKERETHWALLTCCQLILERDSPNNESLFDVCLRCLLSPSSGAYKSLAVDVQLDRIGAMLLTQLNRKPLDLLRQLWKLEDERPPDSATTRTSLAATNFTLLRQLLASNKEEEEEEERAGDSAQLAALPHSTSYTFNEQTLINLANYYLQAGDLGQARRLYRRALALDPLSYQANYNLLLLSRKLAANQHLLEAEQEQPELTEQLKTYMIREQKWLAFLAGRGMILSLVQLASSNASPQPATADRQQSPQSILRQLLASLAWPAPELYLLLLANQTTASTTDHNQQAIALLQQANKEHPYHLPVLEHLIALHIRAFNYEAAKPLLMSCIQNQPDQVKWYRMLAECHKKGADYASAMSVYKTSINAFPRDTSCLKDIINLASELGMLAERNLYQEKLNKALKLNELLPEEVQ